MDRWWDDEGAARVVLAGIDGRDVVQGVGSAVLGYHALAKSALGGLTGRSLVDAADVVDALNSADFSPVAKALSAAVEPVMGDASSEYGRLLASQIHQDAVEGVSHVLTVWSSAGVPMPFAVERAADVVGVPAKRVGSYVNAVKAPVVSPVVRVDAADRSLMDFASYVGARESSAEVSKAVRFREEDHRRDPEGKFAVKPGRSAEDVERLARLERLQRSNAVPMKREDKKPALSDLMSLFDLKAEQRPNAVREHATREHAKREHAVREHAKPDVAKPKEPKARKTPSLSKLPRAVTQRELKAKIVEQPFHVAHDVKDHIAYVPIRLLQQFEKDGFTAGDVKRLLIENQLATELYFSDRRIVESDSGAWSNLMMESGEPMGMLIISGAVPIYDGGTDGEGFSVPNQARFSFQDSNPDPVMFSGRDTPVGHYALVPQQWRFTYDGEELGKSREQWRVDGKLRMVNVERDADGKFADVDPRLERLARLERANRPVARQEKKVSPTLTDLSALLPAKSREAFQPRHAVREHAVREHAVREHAVREHAIPVETVIKPAVASAGTPKRPARRKTAATPQPSTQVFERLDYGKAKGYQMSSAHFMDMLAGEDSRTSLAVNDLDRVLGATFTARMKDPGYVFEDSPLTRFSNLMHNYISVGNGSEGEVLFEQRVSADSGSLAQVQDRAVEIQEDHYARERMESPYTALSSGVRVDSVDGKVVAVRVAYDPGDPPVFVTGSDAALKAFRTNKDVRIAIHESPFAKESLAEAFTMSRRELGDIGNVPIRLVTVSLPGEY
jgi:hypothetical protein